jgi:hypothetical protein
MKIALVVIGDGRGDMLHQSTKAVTEHVLHPISARIMVDDSGDPEYGATLDEAYPEFLIDHGGRRGMAGAVQHGFALAAGYDPDYVLWIEEDMLLTRILPIGDAVDVLESHRYLVQMCFPRDVCDPSEGTDQLASIVGKASFPTQKPKFVQHDFLFSLFPCLIRGSALPLLMDPCPEGSGIEDWLTGVALREGFMFGAWGRPGEPTYARHIGYAQRSVGYRW